MDPTVLFTIAIIITVGLFGFLIYFVNSQFKKLSDSSLDDQKKEDMMKVIEMLQGTFDNRLKDVQGTMDTRLKHVQDQLFQTTDTLNKAASDSSKNMSERLDNAQRVMMTVQKELSTMSEIGRNMKDLQDFLRAPKLRGNIGEQVLKDLLQQMLPAESFKLQHMFKTGDTVDALIKIEDGFISVDSKFPLENFNVMMSSDASEKREMGRKDFVRDVKKHVDAISKKYIHPNEGTVDFALMYIPSEAIYYEVVVNNSELGQYAWTKRVLPVSPNVFYSYLKAILIGLEGKKVESRAKEILAAIRTMKEDSMKFGDALRLLNKHLGNAKNASDDAMRRYESLDNRLGTIDKISGRKDSSDTPLISDESEEEKLF